jgi:fimbrial chaperone protein
MRRYLVDALRAAVVAAAMAGLLANPAGAQNLTVMPVTINLAAGQQAAVLTVENHGDADISFQVRAFAWSEREGRMQLDPTQDVLVSPPLGSILPAGTQAIRVILRRRPTDREATYRILLDQIPPPAKAGAVRIAMRQSMPIFAQPPTRATPHIVWRIERESDKYYLVATNDGTRHETVHDIVLTTSTGASVAVETRTLPYVLGGAFKRWRIDLPPGSALGASLHMVAQSDGGPIDVSVPLSGIP